MSNHGVMLKRDIVPIMHARYAKMIPKYMGCLTWAKIPTVTKPGNFLSNKTQWANKIMPQLGASTVKASATRNTKGMKFASRVEKLKMKESESQTIKKSIRDTTCSRCECGSSASPLFLIVDSN